MDCDLKLEQILKLDYQTFVFEAQDEISKKTSLNVYRIFKKLINSVKQKLMFCLVRHGRSGWHLP